MDLFFDVLIVGAGVTYLIEAAIAFRPVRATLIKALFTLPLAVGGLILLSVGWLPLIICAPAASFVALGLSKLVNRPTIVQSTRRNY